MPDNRDDRPRSLEGPEYVRVQVIGEPGGGPAPGFGPYLRTLRAARGLSLRDAAARMSISFTYLQKLETGVRSASPSLLLLQQLAAAYDVPTAEVLAAAGARTEHIEDQRAEIDKAFQRLVLHPRLMPEGMDLKGWLDSFSPRQKRQVVELAIRVREMALDPSATSVMQILYGRESE